MYTDSLYTHTHTHTQLIYFVVQQKLTQHCKAIILQEKKKVNKYIDCAGSPYTLGTGMSCVSELPPIPSPTLPPPPRELVV